MTAPGPDPGARWAMQLESWAIPEAILAAAPESPWTFPPALFARSAERALADTHPTPSRRRAAEAIPPGGSVLDVGAGAGAASLPLAPPAGLITAVDESRPMLDAFAEGAERIGIDHAEIQGRWPEVSPEVPDADVVVCHHVVYNVADLAPFLRALDGHARRRVVLELTARHPQSDLNPLWLAIHGIQRPAGPTSDDAAEVARSLGYDVQVEAFEHSSMWHGAGRDERIAFARRRLCVGPERDDEIGRHLDREPGPTRRLVSIWWDCPSR